MSVTDSSGARSEAPLPEAGSSDRLVAGLEAIIDAATGVLAAQSLEATLSEMADALAPIVPYTSLAVFEMDWDRRELVALLAVGGFVEETLSSRPPVDDSITGTAVLRREVVVHERHDPKLSQYTMPGTPVNDEEALLVAPLLVGDHVVGTLNVWREEFNTYFLPEERMLIRRFASLAALAYANSAQREQLSVQALTDELTGLFNRRHCERSLIGTLHDSRPREEPTSIAYFDIDTFKSINDTFGHATGDEVLREFADVLRAHTRSGDIVCRTGGEEFTVVLPRTTRPQASQLAERIVTAVREARLGPWGSLTVSAGVATSPTSHDDLDVLVRHADARLMSAKRDGRDRVVDA